MKGLKGYKKVAFHTLGCKLNFSETSTIAREFQSRGYEKVDFSNMADVYVINTCSVTELADKKCRNAIRKAINISPRAKIIAIGCYAQINPDAIANIEGVDLILGTNEKFKIFEFLDKENLNGKPVISMCPIEQVSQFHESYSINERTRAFLKVQDGCDYFCSYCTIPLARGKSRNMPVLEIVKQAKIIADNGVKEIVLTGVNIGDFGRTTNEPLLQLIQELDEVERIERFRISSIEPNLLSDEIINFVNKSKRFVSHFHIPLQSGCDKILGLMRRRYNRELFKDRVIKVKTNNASACIGVDVIVGFPGETDKDFIDTLQFLESIDISYLHIFAFSERRNTQAALMDNKVNNQVKDLRGKQLIDLSEKKKVFFYENNIGNNSKVIFESQKINGKIFGFTNNYIKVETDFKKELVDKIVNCKLIGINQNNNMNIKILD